MKTTTSDLLFAGMFYLEAGWAAVSEDARECPHCGVLSVDALGALTTAAQDSGGFNSFEHFGGYQALHRVVVGTRYFGNIDELVQWADAPERTKDEVLAAYARAIEEAS